VTERTTSASNNLKQWPTLRRTSSKRTFVEAERDTGSTFETGDDWIEAYDGLELAYRLYGRGEGRSLVLLHCGGPSIRVGVGITQPHLGDESGRSGEAFGDLDALLFVARG
jgi:hypothetical protein